MATVLGLMALGILFYFLKYGFNRVVLKKSKDQIELEELVGRQSELILNKSFFTSKEKNDEAIGKLGEEISVLKSKLGHEKL